LANCNGLCSQLRSRKNIYIGILSINWNRESASLGGYETALGID